MKSCGKTLASDIRGGGSIQPIAADNGRDIDEFGRVRIAQAHDVEKGLLFPGRCDRIVVGKTIVDDRVRANVMAAR